MKKKKEILRVIKFTLFSISAGLIQVIADAIGLEILHFPAWLSYLIALVLSVLWNFTLNRSFTFKSANNVPLAMMKVACYYAVFTPLSTWWTNYFVVKVGLNEYLVLAVTMLTNFVTEFLFDTFVVFRGSIDTNERAKRDKQSE